MTIHFWCSLWKFCSHCLRPHEQWTKRVQTVHISAQDFTFLNRIVILCPNHIRPWLELSVEWIQTAMPFVCVESNTIPNEILPMSPSVNEGHQWSFHISSTGPHTSWQNNQNTTIKGITRMTELFRLSEQSTVIFCFICQYCHHSSNV